MVCKGRVRALGSASLLALAFGFAAATSAAAGNTVLESLPAIETGNGGTSSIALASLAEPPATQAAPTQDWLRVFSSTPLSRHASDEAHGIAIGPDGDVVVVGWTDGSLARPTRGSGDAWIIKMDSTGTPIWQRQPGTRNWESAAAVAIDTAGNILVTGITGGSLAGPHHGEFDAWILKLDSDGHTLWQRQPGKASSEFATGIATDPVGDVYVLGLAASGPFLLKLAADGRTLWRRDLGTKFIDWPQRIAADADGNVVAVGFTIGALGGPNKGRHDAWVMKFDADGRLLWKRQPGRARLDFAYDVAMDGVGNTYVVGNTGSSLAGPNQGGQDVWVRKFSPDGAWLWTVQPGTSADDHGFAITTTQSGFVYITGMTGGSLAEPVDGAADAFLIKLNAADGALVWTQQFGSAGRDAGRGVAVGPDDAVYVAGTIDGTSYQGNFFAGMPLIAQGDAFLARYSGEGVTLAPGSSKP